MVKDRLRQRKGRSFGIALVGIPPPRWHSLSRSYLFFRRALGENFRLHRYDSFPLSKRALMKCDVVVPFSPSVGDRRLEVIPHPVVYPIWGGAILQYKLLKHALRAMSSKDRTIVNCTSDIHVVSSMIADQSKVPELLHLPIRQDIFFPTSKTKAKMRLGLGNDVQVIGFVARLIPEKNLHIFLRTLSDLRSSSTKNVVGIIVGDFWDDYPTLRREGFSYRDYIVSLVDSLSLKDGIRLFRAKLTESELNAVYNALDVLVHPTMCVDENFGYVPLEALACGTPVIASAYGGLKDTVLGRAKDHLASTWVTPGGIRMDWRSLTDKVAALLESKEHRRRALRNGPVHVNRAFSYQSATSELRAIMIRAIEGQHPSRTEVEPRGEVTQTSTLVAKRMHKQWPSLIGPVSHYVSRSVPQATLRTRVYAYGELNKVGKASIRLKDPLWNVLYDITQDQMALLDHLGGASCSAQRLLKRGFSLTSIQHLINEGVLVAIDGT